MKRRKVTQGLKFLCRCDWRRQLQCQCKPRYRRPQAVGDLPHALWKSACLPHVARWPVLHSQPCRCCWAVIACMRHGFLGRIVLPIHRLRCVFPCLSEPVPSQPRHHSFFGPLPPFLTSLFMCPSSFPVFICAFVALLAAPAYWFHVVVPAYNVRSVTSKPLDTIHASNNCSRMGMRGRGFSTPSMFSSPVPSAFVSSAKGPPLCRRHEPRFE